MVGVLALLRNGFVRSPLGRHRVVAALPRRLYRAVIAWLVARTGMFDADFYAQHNPDVGAAGWTGIEHYVAAGDFEGRAPMPLFDPAWYREKVGEPIAINALLHYAWFGRARGIAPSRWFDPDFYARHNPDVVAAGVDPLLHFLRNGGQEGRSPSAQFDSAFYLRMNPDVVASRANPLVHWLLWGRAAGLKPSPAATASYHDTESGEPLVPLRSLLPTDADWARAAPRPDTSNALIDVVIPVYKGRTETLRCILSTLDAPVRIPFAVHVIDDASPDPELVEDLHRLSERNLFALHANVTNQGFVRTANRGMGLNPGRDVVLLNSDAEVFGDWLDRLHAAAHRHPRTGTVTPLSNNATICSYPRTLQDNHYPLEIEFAEIDGLAKVYNACIEVEAPTGHGFCLYLRRDCLSDVGTFDEQGFGMGYGEENDLCQRAMRRGWRNVIAADVYVRHLGSASFQDQRPARLHTALAEIARRYPSYHADIARFCALDPLAPARRTLDLQRLRRQMRAHNTLLVSHARGGGTERQMKAEIVRLGEQGRGTFVLRPSATRPGHAVLSSPAVRGIPNLPPVSLSDTAQVATLLRELGVDHIEVHSLVDYPPSASLDVSAIASVLGAPLDVVVHDYENICPRLTLSDPQGVYCGEPDMGGCNRCLRRHGGDIPVSDIGQWRAQRAEFLGRARCVRVPDEDVADRLRRYFSGLAVDVRPHEDPERMPPPVRLGAVPARVPGHVRVVVPGAISRHKGYEILRQCALRARKQNLPLEYVLMGYSTDDSQLAAAGVRITGRYDDRQAVQTLRELDADLVWLPACWPETYSFTLSIALEALVPVVAFDLGAIARRLRRAGIHDQLLPVSAMSDPVAVNAFFLRGVGASQAAA
nr:glycosyltransferase [Panacagrimonas sp.]